MRKLKYAAAVAVTAMLLGSLFNTSFVPVYGGNEPTTSATKETAADETTETTTADAAGNGVDDGDSDNKTNPEGSTEDTSEVTDNGSSDPDDEKGKLISFIDSLGTKEILPTFILCDAILFVLSIVLFVSLARQNKAFKEFKEANIKKEKEFDELLTNQDAKIANLENGVKKLEGPLDRLQVRVNSIESNMPSRTQDVQPVVNTQSAPEPVKQPEPPKVKTRDDIFLDFLNSGKGGTLPDGFISVKLAMNDGNVREDSSGYTCYIDGGSGSAGDVKLYPGKDIKVSSFRRYYASIFDTEGDGKSALGILPCRAIRNTNGDYEIKSKGRVKF